MKSQQWQGSVPLIEWVKVDSVSSLYHKKDLLLDAYGSIRLDLYQSACGFEPVE